ncbi:ABC transporter permease [Streptomyces spiroverticillatus]|uniref:ABC transporter permease n=1 Tax=Streptomyces finlayi TaxID=67296 RepID=A0A918X214_9ACTN|nr:ABC transporter permease [Streptomyces finlayi]GHA23152.1 ABC transporter permease [Streptomyces spiroverticillatus]GHD04732.1 ABC transporter permease [Streptomyces finlayi]
MLTQPALTPTRLRPRDVLHTGSAGLRGRPLRVLLSALGIAIGIATMIAVVGISASSKAQLMDQLDRLGTNLLKAGPGQSIIPGQDVRLPRDSVATAARIPGVEHTAATGDLDQPVYRSELTPPEDTNGIALKAATGDLPGVLRGRLRDGTWLNAANGRYPSVVLGHVAAQRLGVGAPGGQVLIGDTYFTVIGILDKVPLAPDVERSALIGWEYAQQKFGFDGHPTALYERSTDASVNAVRKALGGTINPEHPELVAVSNPADALQAKAAAEGAFTNLLLGLGGVALLVGGVGVANTMIISVLERRHEIGLRRALGATKGQIRIQFVTESLLLSGLGGLAGVALGAAATAVYAGAAGLPWVVPPWAVLGGFGATLVIGTVAGLYPAVRAARLSPTLALHAA